MDLGMKMYFLHKMWILQPAILVFSRWVLDLEENRDGNVQTDVNLQIFHHQFFLPNEN